MPRQPRRKSASDIYHIMMRGINRQNIFEDEEDNIKFLYTLQRYKEKCGYEIFAYCLMGNHIHLLLKIGLEPLEQVFRRICGSYVYWYNEKYQRVGNLFQDRFKSEAVENDAYFLTVLRYIHQNPLQAKMVKNIEHYRWSSINEYKNQSGLVDTCFALNLFSNSRQKAIKELINFCKEINDDLCLEIEDYLLLTDMEVKDLIKKMCLIGCPTDLQRLDKSKRDACLNKLKGKYGLSIRQIERLTGINRGVIWRA